MITTVFCVLVAILSVSLGSQLASAGGSPRSRQSRSRLMLGFGSSAVVLGLVCAVCYLVAFERYVVPEDQMIGNQTRKIRRVIGNRVAQRVS
jgi:hypothetical protein